MVMWSTPTANAIIKIFSGCTKALIEGTKGRCNGMNLPKRSPIKPLVIIPRINAHAPHAIKIKPKLDINLLFRPNPRNMMKPIIASTKP